jgi:hypothetical protein
LSRIQAHATTIKNGMTTVTINPIVSLIDAYAGQKTASFPRR